MLRNDVQCSMSVLPAFCQACASDETLGCAATSAAARTPGTPTKPNRSVRFRPMGNESSSSSRSSSSGFLPRAIAKRSALLQVVKRNIVTGASSIEYAVTACSMVVMSRRPGHDVRKRGCMFGIHRVGVIASFFKSPER